MARNIGVNFNGNHIIHPGAYSRIDANGLNPAGKSGQVPVVFLGTSEGGEPNVVHWIGNLSEARDVLRSGDLVTAAELAWAPSGDVVGAGLVGFIRVSPATQSELVKEALTLKSKDWGEYTNKLQAKLDDGTLVGSKKLTVFSFLENKYEVYDNLGSIFNVQYKGLEVYAGLTIEADTNGKATALVIKTGDDAFTATEKIRYDFSDSRFKDVNKIVNDLAQRPEFTATLVPGKNLKSEALDATEDQPIKASVYTVKAFGGDLAYQTRYSKYIEKPEFTGGSYPANFGYTFFSGGSDGTTPSSWADKFDLLDREGAYFIVPLTSDEAIHAESARFIELQSTEGRNECRGVYGGALDETVDRVISRAISLSSDRAILCYPGITRKAVDGTVEELPPYFLAAAVAGRQVGVGIGEPITFDYLNLIGVEKVLSKTDVERLIENGVLALEYVYNRNRKGFRIAQAITTYQEDANPYYREISVGMVGDFLSIELRERLESQFVGAKGTKQVVALIKNEVQSFLDEKVRADWIVDYDKASVSVSLSGDVVNVEYACQPVNSINFILITTRFYQKDIVA